MTAIGAGDGAAEADRCGTIFAFIACRPCTGRHVCVGVGAPLPLLLLLADPVFSVLGNGLAGAGAPAARGSGRLRPRERRRRA
ncbi:Os11g0303400 [Oryza sativa Japonica Group]|uniref:Os11g0303400 protein n=2 Tax=Oryza sativa subsp. japonica TaxID=39947 RepID=B9GAF5_ORYSJ|nr:hypothetical protein OsJ_33720 [Oryza sativa Japonica Group]KAB8115022.1 hypothetical protein EE612_054960 [Oryza sativa]BAT13699.1 Os11g0303400 [Oryza sativa Japonica Group]